MFSYITKNWRGKPLESHEVIVNLIGNPTTKTGLRIQAGLDSRIYPKGIEALIWETAQTTSGWMNGPLETVRMRRYGSDVRTSAAADYSHDTQLSSEG